jgi:hypothetical protein
MYYRLWVVGCLLLSACGGGQAYAAPASIKTAVAPEDAFNCVKRQMTDLGYKQSSVDSDERRVNGTKIDLKTRRPDTQFRRMVDKLEVEVSPQADGQTSIDVRGRTFAEYTTQRGPTEVEEKASPEVKAASQQMLERCRG